MDLHTDFGIGNGDLFVKEIVKIGAEITVTMNDHKNIIFCKFEGVNELDEVVVSFGNGFQMEIDIKYIHSIRKV